MERRDRSSPTSRSKYGRERVGADRHLHGTKAARASCRDVGRVHRRLRLRRGAADRQPHPLELGQTTRSTRRSRSSRSSSASASDEDRRSRELLDQARKLEGLTRHAGKHAGGVVISDGSVLTDSRRSTATPTASSVVTQYYKDDVEAAGLVKFDFLGLQDAHGHRHRGAPRSTRGRATRGEPALDHRRTSRWTTPTTYKLLASGSTTGRLPARVARDAGALQAAASPTASRTSSPPCALYRPGPLAAGMVEDFVNRKHGGATRPSTTLHPRSTRSSRDLRRHRLPGAGDADRAGARRLHARRRRPAPARDGQEEARGDGEAEAHVRRRRGGARRPAAAGASASSICSSTSPATASTSRTRRRTRSSPTRRRTSRRITRWSSWRRCSRPTWTTSTRW